MHPTGLEINEPVETLQEVLTGPGASMDGTVAIGKTMSSIDVQERYLEAATRSTPDKTKKLIGCSRSGNRCCIDLRGDYTKLIGRVDWASKLWLLETFRDSEHVEWDDPALKSLDLEYHNLHPDKGLYYGLIEEGHVPR